MFFLLGILIGAIKSVLNLVAEVIAYFLLTFRLWVPAVYTVAFLIVCGFARIPLSEAWSFFLIGLVISFLISGLLLFLAYRKRFGDQKKNRFCIVRSRMSKRMGLNCVQDIRNQSRRLWPDLRNI